MKLLKSISLCMILACANGNAYAFDNGETNNDIISTVKDAMYSSYELSKNVAICVGLVAVPYLAGKGCSIIVLAMAQKRFEADIRTLQYGNTMQLYQSINSHYNQRVNTFFISNNDPLMLFPLIRYKNDLDFYINSLWCLQAFNLQSDRLADIQYMVQELKTLRTNITSWPQFNEEQQRYYVIQQKQNKNKPGAH